jgi:Protein of unknown function (DUF1653)
MNDICAIHCVPAALPLLPSTTSLTDKAFSYTISACSRAILAMTDPLVPLPRTIPGKYRHYKGLMYEVIGTARHSESLEPMTVYRALYGEHGLWVRPSAMFSEDVVIDGLRQPRFAKVRD